MYHISYKQWQIHTVFRHLHLPLSSDECSMSPQCVYKPKQENHQMPLGSFTKEFLGIDGIDLNISKWIWEY